MKRAPTLVLLSLLLAACGENAKPQTKAPEPVAAAPAPAPAAAPAAVATAAPAAQAPKPDPDKELAQRVKRALEGEEKIQAAAIDVTASGGTVTLWGTAASADERTRASRIAYRVQGVTTVENKLAVVKGS